MQQDLSNDIEYQAGATLVDEGITFDIEGIFGGKRRFRIRPLRPGTIVRISMEIRKMQPVEEDQNLLHELFEKAENIRHFATILAHAVINSEVSRRWKLTLYRWMFLNRIKSMDHLYSYFLLAIRQMGPERFFFIMALARKMQLTEKKTPLANTAAETPFGEPLPSSRKHSD